MEKKTYDEITFRKIKDLIGNGFYLKATAILQKYMQTYPSDQWARLELLRVLKYQNRLDEAMEQALIIKKSSNFKDYIRLEKYVNLELWNLYISLCQYEKAYKYLSFVSEYRKRLSAEEEEKLYLDELYLKHRLGILSEKDKEENNCYLALQIMDYNEKRALKHIKNHKYEDLSHQEYDMFEEEIDVYDIYYKVRSVIADASPLEFQTIEYVYYFEYPEIKNISLKDNYPYKYLKVVALKDTKQIVTMHPVFAKERLSIVNSLEKEKTKTKKSMSQIEKFNKKYGMVN